MADRKQIIGIICRAMPAIDGPMPDDIAAMTDDELLAELRQ
jgi:hypothetical protein